MRQQQATASCWINCGDTHRKNRWTQGRRSLGSRHRKQGSARSRAGDEEKQTLSVLQCVSVSINVADIYDSVNHSQSHSTMFFLFFKNFLTRRKSAAVKIHAVPDSALRPIVPPAAIRICRTRASVQPSCVAADFAV